MHLILVDPKPQLCSAFDRHFAGLPDVETVVGRFEDLPRYDCMVSAANSFGLMDGGVDFAISQFFGWDLRERVQARIIAEYLGEQPVGTSMIVETNHVDHPYVAHTPTMRVPMPISDTDNVYLAMSAMLRAVHDHNRTVKPPISIVACPGLGTTTGRVPFEDAARQMSQAYRCYLDPPKSIDWDFATRCQFEIEHGRY